MLDAILVVRFHVDKGVSVNLLYFFSFLETFGSFPSVRSKDGLERCLLYLKGSKELIFREEPIDRKKLKNNIS